MKPPSKNGDLLASYSPDPCNVNYDRIYKLSTATGQSASVVHAPISVYETILHVLKARRLYEDQHFARSLVVDRPF